MWQDAVISIAGILLGYGLVFQVVRNFKTKSCDIAMHTAIIMFIGMSMIAISLFSLGLYISTLINAFIALMWLVLFVQCVLYKKTIS